jgi:hypothetical protein
VNFVCDVKIEEMYAENHSVAILQLMPLHLVNFNSHNSELSTHHRGKGDVKQNKLMEFHPKMFIRLCVSGKIMHTVTILLVTLIVEAQIEQVEDG